MSTACHIHSRTHTHTHTHTVNCQAINVTGVGSTQHRSSPPGIGGYEPPFPELCERVCECACPLSSVNWLFIIIVTLFLFCLIVTFSC